MAETTHPPTGMQLARIEPADRLVILARTIDLRDLQTETALKDNALDFARLGENCLGQAIYRHRQLFRNASAAPVWSHLELSYFQSLVPGDAIRELVIKRQPAAMDLLRAEILLTTPSSFALPRDWQGLAGRPQRQASLEYIQVEPKSFDAYRNVMRDYCGPAAAKLVRAGRFGTFRAMETAAVLYQDPGLQIEWNQIHLCDLDTDGFRGFGPEFEAALREDPPAAVDTSGVFAGLAQMRTVPRWTFNDAVVEADTLVAREGTTQ